MNSPVTNSGGVNFQAMLATGDIQTLIQMVQSERVRLLDTQLVDQVKAVQARNDQIAKLNTVLAGLNSYASQIDGTDAGSKPKGSEWSNDKIKQYEMPLNDAIQDAGITDLGFQNRTGQRTPQPGETKDGSAGKLLSGTNVITGSVTKGEIDAAITKVKGLIDAESNNQQMDMLRLQSLNNKKNESIEILTNTQKKHTDANSNIIRNI
ncbi:type III secretion system needle tip complex Bsp22 [Castellaniella ginsengisoli]|uniref:Type III secretion system needle tip complex Bsp22 n=1 Tax=Castellaniella ginsengisoli TaxID=546114 RepID=A0ABP3WCL5_9BURK